MGAPEFSRPEFSRMVKAHRLPAKPLALEATAEERAALAERFGVAAIDSLQAEVSLGPDKQAIVAEGRLSARLVQTCAVSAEDFPVTVEEPLALRFVPPAAHKPEAEIELDADACDEIEFVGESFDLGEAIAQTLGLAIDPYAEGPNAEAAREKTGIASDDAPSGPLAEALKGLKKEIG